MNLTENEKIFFKEIIETANAKTSYFDVPTYSLKHYLEKIFGHYVSEDECIEDLKEMMFKIRLANRYRNTCCATNIKENKIELIAKILEAYRNYEKENENDK